MEELIFETYKSIGENIRRFRLIEQMSQDNLATKSKLTGAYISQIERQCLNKGITCTAMIKIANALEIPPCILMSQKPCQKYFECLYQITEKIINR